MADRVDVKLKSKDPNNENTTTTISYVNPEATNGEMKAFAQKLNALTRNTYSSSDKIETTNLDLAPSGGGALTPTLTLSQNALSKATVLASQNMTGSGLKGAFKSDLATVNYDGDGTVYAYCPIHGWYAPFISDVESGTFKLGFMADYPENAFDQVFTTPLTIKVCATATDNYKAVETEFTITG